MTAHNPHKRETSMPPGVVEPIIPTSENLQAYALDRKATGIGALTSLPVIIVNTFFVLTYTSCLPEISLNKSRNRRMFGLK
jgi:hypothetical protein